MSDPLAGIPPFYSFQMERYSMNSLTRSDNEAEAIAARKGGKRISLTDIENEVAERLYFTGAQAARITRDMNNPASINPAVVMPLACLTLCILVLRNGFTVVGKSAPADPQNFDPGFERQLAYEDALRQVWPLMGYHLRQKLHERGQYEKPPLTGEAHPSVPVAVMTLSGGEEPVTGEAHPSIP